MQKGERIAIARIFDDLIKADRIVDTGEMEHWKKMCLKYEINKEEKIAARDISFADALHTICNSTEEDLRAGLLADCRAMTVSDGFCAHPEALLMIALTILLDPDRDLTGDVISTPRANFNIDTATALYIENEYDAGINEAINIHYRSIFKELQLAGIHFIYIPKIIDHYKNTDKALFKDILSFLAPSMDDRKLSEAFRSLTGMTTGMFCKDLLCNKCGITELRDTYPSLLIKIGNSYVGEAQYANYLKIETDEGILDAVRDLADRVSDMQSSDTFVINTSEERNNQFHFHGFYKQLLDIYLVPRNERSEIHIYPYGKGLIEFPGINSQATGLNLRERVLYALFLCQGSEGCCFTPPHTAAGLKKFNRKMELIRRRYAALYGMFGGKNDKVPDLSVPETRRPIFSCVKKSISRLKGLYNPEDYTITKGTDGTFSVHVEPELIFVHERGEKNPVPLMESEMYRKWKEA